MSYRDVIAGHLAAFDRTIDKVAVGRVKRLYDAAQAELEQKLARAVGKGRGDTMTAHQHRAMLLQVHDGQRRLAGRMAAELGDVSDHARAESVHQLHRDVARLDAHFGGAAVRLPTEAAGRFHDVMNRGRASVMAGHQASMARYGTRVVGQMEGALGLSVAVGEAPHEAIQRVMDVADNEWWQAERIVRTETAWAMNGVARDALDEGGRDDPGLWSRWTEHVSAAGAAMDDRVGVDSLALHGQVARSGEEFTMPMTAPDGRPVSSSLVGMFWAHPPNRPNDRAVLAPWRPEWGTPGWRYVAGERVPVPVNEGAAEPGRSRRRRRDDG